MLTGKQKRFLRGLGHALKPVLMVGKNEVNESLVSETDGALSAHELIKVKVLEGCEMDRHEVAESLSKSCGADVAQVLGRTFLLYRAGEQPTIELPADKRK